jgi:isoleucyl-tRNA synthetase
MVRWIAPILSFTADEIWRLLPGDRSASVFAQTWHVFPQTPERGIDWSRLGTVRERVKKVLEDLRIKGQIGSGLNADVALYANGPLGAALSAVGEELRFWFITSSATVQAPERRTGEAVESRLEDGEAIWVQASPSPHPKCERCWHQRADVGAHASHPTLCGRCVENVAGDGEHRSFI